MGTVPPAAPICRGHFPPAAIAPCNGRRCCLCRLGAHSAATNQFDIAMASDTGTIDQNNQHLAQNKESFAHSLSVSADHNKLQLKRAWGKYNP